AAVIAVLLLAGPLRLRDGLRPQPGQWRTCWAFAAPRGLSAAIDAGGMWVGVLLTAALAGQAQAGIFGAVGRYVLAGLLVMQGLRLALAPQLSKLLGSGRTAAAAAVYRRTSTAIIALSWPLYAVLATYAPGFLSLFGAEFAAGAPAMAVLCVAMLVNSGAGLVQTVLLMSGHSRRHLVAAATGLAGNLILGVTLIPRFGALGAALAWSVAIVVENVLAAVAARRVLGEPLFDRLTRRVAAGAVLAGLVAVAVAVPFGRGVTGLAAVLTLFTCAAVAALLHPRGHTAVRRFLKEHVRVAA
ncbi:MAG TPA: polysaccharide biosynthesis C-terminal domain-containing protein, partial [Actinoplanes sp.]|nr:polysaccharide biosynthesis C-terminal domain-containing protein [Actinoplanes sp.]